MKTPGKDIAKGLLVLAFIIAGLNYFLIWMFNGYTFKAFGLWPLILGLGLAMLIFPGASVPERQASTDDDDTDTKENEEWFSATPTLHKIMWVVGIVVGFLITRYINLH